MKHERSTSASGSADGLDVLLGSFRAPASLSRRTDAEWDDSAATTVQKALSGDAGDTKFIESLLAPPSLGREAGEPSSVVVGESKMSTDRDPKSSSGPSSSGAPSVRPRPSLKELAERVSKTPPPPSVQPGPRASVPELPVATMKTGSSGVPVAAATSSATAPQSTATPLPISSPSAAVRIVEASAAAHDASSPTSKMPATLPTGVTPIHAAKGGKNGGMLVGLGVAALGLAAAAAMFFYVKSHKAVDAPKQAVQQEQVEAASTAKAGDKAEPSTPEVAKVDKPSDGALD